MGIQNIGNIPVATAPLNGSECAPSGTVTPPGFAPFVASRGTAFGAAIGAAPTTKEEIVYQANNNGTVVGFHASVLVPGSAASITLDLKKNGTTVLSAVVTLTNASTARVPVNATIAVPSYVAGDVFSISLVEGSNTGMSGLFAYFNFWEQSQPI